MVECVVHWTEKVLNDSRAVRKHQRGGVVDRSLSRKIMRGGVMAADTI